MFDDCLPMGCLSSRSTSVSPGAELNQTRTNAKSQINKSMANGAEGGQLDKSAVKVDDSLNRNGLDRPKDNQSDSGPSKIRRFVNIGTSLDRQSDSFQLDGNEAKEYGEIEDEEQDRIMTMLMNGKSSDTKPPSRPNNNDNDNNNNNNNNNNNELETDRKSYQTTPNLDEREREGFLDDSESSSAVASPQNGIPREKEQTSGVDQREPRGDSDDQVAVAITRDKSIDGESGESSFEEELNMDLLRQYIAVDFEISQLEDRDALRLYHEKIEQLEQLERELDMISFEAEEVAVRSEVDLSTGQQKDTKIDMESNSILSGVSGSLSVRSSIVRRPESQQNQNSDSKKMIFPAGLKKIGSKTGTTKASERGSRQLSDKKDNLSYATIEEVFNRKIILEKERDKLKKEVEMVIIECDRLQNKYKKRDEVLDKLFDGRTGNGLENHLEQQLNWLMEQKNYVDQVFYSWKRAETLTSQTCEQFASALELLKRIPKIQNEEERNELSKSVCELLIKSRNDMEQAQKYNPNVDAPFFTDAETERFDKIIETIQSNAISQNDYNQMATVVQFAYKRAVSIRLWLEQILQITIARDSFELAEEYKWIAIQLRKERISLINLKLQDPPYRAMAQSIREQLSNQNQRQLQLDHSRQLAITDGVGATTKTRQNEINRDSGIESDDIDIEEDIYRLLEMNRSRLEAAVAASREVGGGSQTITLDSSGRPVRLTSGPSSTSTASGLVGNRLQQQQLSILAGSNQAPPQSGSSSKTSQHDQIMQERIQRRARGEQQLALGGQAVANGRVGKTGSELGPAGRMSETTHVGANREVTQRESATQASSGANMTPSKLRIELDEESRKSLLKQVDQIHSKHRNNLNNLRGSNKAKANDLLMRMQSSKRQIKDGDRN